MCLEHRKSSITSGADAAIIIIVVAVVLEPRSSKPAVVLLRGAFPQLPTTSTIFLSPFTKVPACVSFHSHVVSPALHKGSSEVAGC